VKERVSVFVVVKQEEKRKERRVEEEERVQGSLMQHSQALCGHVFHAKKTPPISRIWRNSFSG
jgi:hypothetical protein